MKSPRIHSLRFVYSVPRESEEPFVAELWQRGTLGIEVHDPTAINGAARNGARDDAAAHLRLDAYFADPGAAAELDLRAIEPIALAEPGESGRALGVTLDRIEPVEERDWLAAWRSAVQPVPVGRGFLLDPREPEESAGGETATAAESRVRLRLPARGAFGTGSHESTRLALELLEDLALDLPLVGRTVLDIGTGTGVLAFAAAILGAAAVCGCDVDPVATFHAIENRRLNLRVLTAAPSGATVPLRWWAGGLAALGPEARFDAVVVNVLPERILSELPWVAGTVAAGGSVIYSGALEVDVDDLAARFATLGLTERKRRVDGEWAALRLDRE